MNLRLAVSLVSLGTLAVGCRQQSHTTVASGGKILAQPSVTLASIGGGDTRSAKTVEKTVKGAPDALVTRFDVALEGDDVRFNLRVVNATRKNVEVNFPSGQAYDFVVLDSVGREVWRWSSARIFTQSVRNKLLAKGDAITASEKWSPAKPGKFTAIAQLTSSNFPIQEQVTFQKQ